MSLLLNLPHFSVLTFGGEALLTATRSPGAVFLFIDWEPWGGVFGARNQLTMPEPNLILVCAVAFATVITLLSILAGLIRLITFLFPEKTDESDPAVVAAIHTAVSTSIPGAKVTHIEEIE